MIDPKSPEEALNHILVNSEVPTTQAMAARGLGTTETGRKILQEHEDSKDLPKHHLSIPAILREATRPSNNVSSGKTANLNAPNEHGFDTNSKAKIPNFGR